MSEAPAGGRVQSRERAIALLEAVGHVSPEGESVAPVAVRCWINRATAWRLLGELTVRAAGEVAALVDPRAALS